MTDSPLLTLGYSALAERAHNISLPVAGREVESLLCLQGGPPPAGLASIRIVDVPGIGVARSRNAAIDHAAGDYLLFCDDDVTVNLPGVLAAVRHLQATGHALALGQAIDPSGHKRKRYSPVVHPLNLFNSAKAATYEMLIDVAQVRASGIRFDERFGAGTELYLGDEYIFISDLLRAGLSAEAVPLTFGMHPELSSGVQWGSAADCHARAMAINRAFGRWSWAGRVAFGAKNFARFGGLQAALQFLADGSEPVRGRTEPTVVSCLHPVAGA